MVQDLTKDPAFSSEIEKVLSEDKPTDRHNTSKAIIRVISNYLSSYLKEEYFPGREKLARKITEKIKTRRNN